MKMKTKVLAVLALALLMINMAPVMRAEAAEDTLTVNWKGKEVYLPLRNYPYYCIVKDGMESGSDAVYLSFDKLTVTRPTVGSAYYGFGVYDSTGNADKTKNMVRFYGYDFSETDFSESYGEWYAYTLGTSLPSATRVISNYDICYFDTGAVVYEANPFYPDPEYSPDAPYFTDVTYSNVNLFMIDGNTNFEDSTFRFIFDIVDDGSEYIRRTAKLSGYVYLPSKEFIDKAVEYYMGGRSTLDAYYSIYSCDAYPNWLKSLDLGDGSTYKKWAISFDVDCGDTLDLRLSHEQIFHLIEERNGIDLREYYGIDKVAFIDHILKGYMWVQRIDGYLTTTYSDVIKYGNVTSFVMSTYLKDPVIVVGNSDPLFVGPSQDFVGPMLPDADVQQDINQAYKDALDEAMKENEDLNNTLDGYYDIDGAFGDLNGSDIWSGFKGVSNGILTLSSSVRSIASAVGNVFAFFPGEVTSILYAGFIAIIVISIVKAIRG